MKLGVDLGTTRTLVAMSDRGNFPIVSFTGSEGDTREYLPTVSAEVDGQLVHGARAEAAIERGACHLRSWKRLLGRHGPEHRVTIGAVECSLLELATDYLTHVRSCVLGASNAPRGSAGEPLEVVVSVPANAHSSQRWATLEAFRRAGFSVRRMMNEPSAAAIEFASRHQSAITSRREQVAVYDLGGGTFDAALVTLSRGGHDVVATDGVQELGGDDFDRELAELVLERATLTRERVEACWIALLDECRIAKESLGPSSKKLVLELESLGALAPSSPVVISVADYYERVRPLVDRSLEALAKVLGAESCSSLDLENAATEAGMSGLYVVGGGSTLPFVARELRERFGRRVHRSAHPAGSIAIGLAIASELDADTALSERMTRHLGVFREAESGRVKTIDRIFDRGTAIPQEGADAFVVTRRYRAAHDVGQLRIVECAGVDAEGVPVGDITPHPTVYFPYSKDARSALDIAADSGSSSSSTVSRLDGVGPAIEERYSLDSNGVVTVTISDLEDGFRREFTL